LGTPRITFSSHLNPDILYLRVIKAIKENPKLSIVHGTEAKRHLDLVLLEREKYYYFELSISFDGKESCIEFTTSKLEHQKELAKAVAVALPSIVRHLSYAVCY